MNIYETITKVMEEVPAISKDKKNTTQGFAYRGIDDVMNVFNPLFAKYHLFITPTILEQTREERQTSKGGNLIYSICKIQYTFYAEDGTNISAVVIGEGMDSGDKATNKAMAIAMKYALFQVFCIPTAEMKDPDGETPEPSKPIEKKVNENDPISETQEKAIRDLANKVDKDHVIATMKDFGYEKFAEIKQKDYMNIVKNLESGKRN